MIDMSEFAIPMKNMWEMAGASYGFLNAIVAYQEYKRKYPKRRGSSWETLAKRIEWYGGKKGKSAWKRYKALAKKHRQEDGRRVRQRAQAAAQRVHDACGTAIPIEEGVA